MLCPCRSLAADGRSWRRDTGDASSLPRAATASTATATTTATNFATATPPTTSGRGSERVGGGGNDIVSVKEDSGSRTGAGMPRAVSVGWWSEDSLGAMTSAGNLAFLDAASPPSSSSPPPSASALLSSSPPSSSFQEMTTAFQGDARGDLMRGGAPRPPPLGPQCTVWFAGDGRRAVVCWPGASGGGGRWGRGSGGGRGGVSLGRGRGAGEGGGVRSGGAAGSVVGLLSLGTAEEAVEGRVRRGLLGEALDLAVREYMMGCRLFCAWLVCFWSGCVGLFLFLFCLVWSYFRCFILVCCFAFLSSFLLFASFFFLLRCFVLRGFVLSCFVSC